MRTTLVVVVLLLIAAAGYAYNQNPAGCAKVGGDIVAVLQSLRSPVASAQAVAPAPAPQPAAAVPAVTPAPASAQASTPAPTAPTPAPVKPWTPPDVMPAQPNWTWTTLDGTTYQNVVVTKIEPVTVSITHSMGVAHIPISTLPPDIQKQLNYDPAAAEAARAEAQRESEHPYYTVATRVDAQAVAQQMHRPLAWVSSRKEDLLPNAVQDDETSLTLQALDFLKDKSIVIFLDCTEMPQIPAIVHHQFSQYDDGTLAGGANYMPPKVVFSTPDAGTILGRVSYTQMKTGGTLAINDGLDTAKKTWSAQTPSTAPVPATSP